MLMDDTKFMCSARQVNGRMYELPDFTDEPVPVLQRPGSLYKV